MLLVASMRDVTGGNDQMLRRILSMDNYEILVDFFRAMSVWNVPASVSVVIERRSVMNLKILVGVQ